MPDKLLPPTLRIGRSRTGLGLFSLETIRRGTLISEYVGERISNDEADQRRSKYLFEVSSRTTIDGAAKGNLARYINHSCKPNAHAEIRRGRVFIYADRRIEPGDEITYNYGRNYFRSIIEPLGCRCVPCESTRRPRKIAADRPRKAANTNRISRSAKAG